MDLFRMSQLRSVRVDNGSGADEVLNVGCRGQEMDRHGWVAVRIVAVRLEAEEALDVGKLCRLGIGSIALQHARRPFMLYWHVKGFQQSAPKWLMPVSSGVAPLESEMDLPCTSDASWARLSGGQASTLASNADGCCVPGSP